MDFRAAATLCRGVLPAVVLGASLAGCRADGGPETVGPDDPTPEVASSPGDPAEAGVRSPAAHDPAAPAPMTGAPRRQEEAETDAIPDRAAPAPESSDGIVYHVVKGARFFDILVARIGNREHVVLGEMDDLCLDLPDQRDFDGDGHRDALVFQSPRCRGDEAPGLLFFVSGDTRFHRSNPFPGHRPRIEPWSGGWSVLTGGTRYVFRAGRAVRVDGVDLEGLRGPASGQVSAP